MSQNFPSKEAVRQAFQALLQARRQGFARITTKEEAARQAESQALVAEAKQFTPDAIVKGLADLQLQFGNSLQGLNQDLKTQLERLEDIKQSISVEQAHLRYLDDLKIAADALHILKEEQKITEEAFNEQHETAQNQLQKDIAAQREDWQEEQKRFEQAQAEAQALLEKAREKEIADYKYELDRRYKVEADEHEEDKKQLQRELAEIEAKKTKDWQKREKLLKQKESDFKEHKSKVDGFEKTLKTETQKAREEAIRKANLEAKTAADLLEKEAEGQKIVLETQIQNLEESIKSNEARIAQLQKELKEALGQVQGLTLRAIEGYQQAGKK